MIDTSRRDTGFEPRGYDHRTTGRSSDPVSKTITFLAPDHLGDDPNNCFFEISLPHIGRGSIRMEPFSMSMDKAKHLVDGISMADVANGLLSNKGFFTVDVRRDLSFQDVYVPEGMGLTLSNRWKNDDYILFFAGPREGGTVLHAILNGQGSHASLDWLFNILLSRAEIVAKLGFNRKMGDQPTEAEKADTWGDLAGKIWNNVLNRGPQESRSCCGGPPMEKYWAIAKAKLPQGDAFDFLMTPVNTLAVYSGLLK